MSLYRSPGIKREWALLFHLLAWTVLQSETKGLPFVPDEALLSWGSGGSLCVHGLGREGPQLMRDENYASKASHL